MCQRFSFFFLLLLLAGCAVNPVTGRNELALMSISTPEEIEIGKKTFPEVLQQMGGAYPDAALETYVNQVGTRMGRLSHRPDLPYQFRVVNDSTPNAFALPGGYIAISRGLLVGLKNESQLASVLGHEVGHVTARHSVQGMQRSSMLNLGVAVLGAAADTTGYGGLARPAGDLAANLINNTYSRDQESESDRLGIDYMVKAGYDPLGSVQVQDYFYRQVEGGLTRTGFQGCFAHIHSRAIVWRQTSNMCRVHIPTLWKIHDMSSRLILFSGRRPDCTTSNQAIGFTNRPGSKSGKGISMEPLPPIYRLRPRGLMKA